MRRKLLVLAAVMIGGCAALRSSPQLPEQSSLVRDQLIIHTDFRLATKHRLVEELAALRGDVVRHLDVPVSDEPIHVYLFDEAKKYRKYIHKHYPVLPNRRAFFVETDTLLTVYAQWGDRVAEDLRHEVTHGYLHAVVPNLPLWMDEGLAEFFETPRGWDGLHLSHLKMLDELAADGKWKPDLGRLAELATLDQMTQRDYAEAWLWIHFLLETTRERRLLLQHHLAVLREAAQAPSLSRVLHDVEPDAAYAVREHLRMLADANRVE